MSHATSRRPIGRSASGSTSCSSSVGWSRRGAARRRSCWPARSGSVRGDGARLDRKPGDTVDPAAEIAVDAAGAVRQPRRPQARGGARRVRDRPGRADRPGRRRVDRRLHGRAAAARRAPRLRARRGSWPARRTPCGAMRGSTSMERTNARTLTATTLPEPIDLAVIDVSFISLDKVLGPIARDPAAQAPRSSPWSSRSSRRARAARTTASCATRRSTARCSSGSSQQRRGTGSRHARAHRLADPRPGGQPRVPRPPRGRARRLRRRSRDRIAEVDGGGAP